MHLDCRLFVKCDAAMRIVLKGRVMIWMEIRTAMLLHTRIYERQNMLKFAKTYRYKLLLPTFWTTMSH